MTKGTLYVVGTPIGNLSDITLRALDTLKAVDLIACEDTRHTRILLDRYQIKKPLVSYYKQKEREGTERIVEELESGKNVALVTDAGTPCISDPGAILVAKCIELGLSVESGTRTKCSCNSNECSRYLFSKVCLHRLFARKDIGQK